MIELVESLVAFDEEFLDQLVLLFVAIFAPWLAPNHYATADLTKVNIFPNREYPFGTDQIGHNYLSRVIYGIRTSYLVGFLAVIVACLIGIPLGLAAGLRGGRDGRGCGCGNAGC